MKEQLRKIGKQTIMLYVLELHSDVCQLFLNKTGKKNYMSLDKKQDKGKKKQEKGLLECKNVIKKTSFEELKIKGKKIC